MIASRYPRVSPAFTGFLAILSGVLLALPFLNFALAPLAWFALVPLLAAASFRPVRTGAALGFLAGCVFNFAGLHWLRAVTGAGYAILALYLALYWAGWAGFVSFVSLRRTGWLWWSAPAGLVALEFLRSHLFTGFPWNLLGVSQALNTPLIQIASWTGVYGLSFLVALANSAIVKVFLGGKIAPSGWLRGLLPVGIVFAILGAVWLYGEGELREAQSLPPASSLNLCLVQGGISQDLKWDPALAPRHLETYLRLTRGALPTHPDLVLWPESAVPYYVEEREDVRTKIGDLCAEGRTHLLFGGDAREKADGSSARWRYFNRAYLFDAGGGMAGHYDKVHLVPFGEYVPLRKFLPFVRRMVPWEDDFSAGADLPLLPIAPGKSMAVLICYEDIFPGLVREFCRKGPALLANVTNDAWYGRTSAPFQHAYAALFRAVENRVYLARSTNTGYSCLVDPQGRIVSEVRGGGGETLFIAGSSTAAVSLRPAGSFYTRHGDLFAWACVILSLAAALRAGWARQKATTDFTDYTD